MIGQTISYYRILEKIGEGGMGIVYKAQDTRLDRLVALKFLPHHLSANEAEKARFLQEAKAASSLNHPNVCTIYGIGEHEGEQFIEMEFVEGVTLRQKIPVEKMSTLIAYAVQTADALQEAHAKGIVHRDIKSDNIMINEKNQIKVMDFGLAKLKGTLKLTRTSSTVGTLSYMSPEQIRGKKWTTERYFSFAVVLFEMVTGKLPFRGDHEAAMMYSIMNEEPEEAQKYAPEISPEFLHILNRGLEKDPAERYQSIQEMLIDLRRLQKQSTKVSRASMAAMPVPPREAAKPSEGGEVAAGSGKKFPRVKIVAAIGALILVAVIVKVFFTDRHAGSPFASVRVARLTTSGKATIAAISPDGRYVAYALSEGEKASLMGATGRDPERCANRSYGAHLFPRSDIQRRRKLYLLQLYKLGIPERRHVRDPGPRRHAPEACYQFPQFGLCFE
jgi:predicted Ser/Thr protein kinase